MCNDLPNSILTPQVTSFASMEASKQTVLEIADFTDLKSPSINLKSSMTRSILKQG